MLFKNLALVSILALSRFCYADNIKVADANGFEINSATPYYLYSLKKCGDSWSVSPVYQKSQLLGYHAFKQDNNYNRTPVRFELHNAQAIKDGNNVVTKVSDTLQWNMASTITAYKNLNACAIPGACGSAGWHDWIIFIYERVLELIKNSNEGKYYMGVPSRDSIGDYAYNGNPSIAKYGFKHIGHKVRVDGRNNNWVRAYVLTANGGSKNAILECKGDDIWFENWYDESLFFFTRDHYPRGSLKISCCSSRSNSVESEETVEVVDDYYQEKRKSHRSDEDDKEKELEYAKSHNLTWSLHSITDDSDDQQPEKHDEL